MLPFSVFWLCVLVCAITISGRLSLLLLEVTCSSHSCIPSPCSRLGGAEKLRRAVDLYHIDHCRDPQCPVNIEESSQCWTQESRLFSSLEMRRESFLSDLDVFPKRRLSNVSVTKVKLHSIQRRPTLPQLSAILSAGRKTKVVRIDSAESKETKIDEDPLPVLHLKSAERRPSNPVRVQRLSHEQRQRPTKKGRQGKVTIERVRREKTLNNNKEEETFQSQGEK